MILSKAMSMKQRKAKVQSLIDTFAANKSYFMSKEFNEAQTRAQFIDPFLECLQWDVKNEQGLRPDYRDVIPEDRIQVGERTKHPDYTLCCCGMRKIYVEAKQPSVDLKQDPEPALQVRRYAYSAKMPVAILTDFQEFAVYDTRIKPSAKDSAATARIEYFTFDQYAEKFEELYRKFSYEAVSHGDFDTYFESAKDKKGTASVDNDILAMIEDWRTLLAEDIALHNTEIDEYNLTGSVQKIIDRILFLRICEDKEIESYDTLKNIAESKAGIYEKLKTLFDAADQKFNSGLFKKDSFTDGLNLQDKTLITIINALYYPICQYEFSVLPVEILGSIYERFLGKIIRFSRKTKNGHSVEVVEKPEVQKAGGVYYTPTYIVKYIVKNTIGKKIEGKTPEEVAAMHFVDPACGSGSFLIGAYQYLLDFHLNYYDTDKNRAKAEKKGVIYKDARTKEYKLSVEEKKRILVNNIYGVDIDAQAVEVTKLSLFLKLLENEGKALSGIANDLFKGSDMTGGKILPDMSGNIKCGNSLIGSDFYADKDLTLFGMEEQRKVNVFDWDKQFAAVFKNGGFDCVIGNPPYVKEYTSTECFNGLHDHPIYQGKMDLWYFFGYKGIELLKQNGLVGFIAPNNWITNAGASKFRNFILDNAQINKFIDFGNYKVFSTASIQTMIYIMQKVKPENEYSVQYQRLNNDKATTAEVIDFCEEPQTENATFFTSKINKEDCYDKYILFLDSKINDVLAKIAKDKDYFMSEEITTGIDVHQDFCNKDSQAILGDGFKIGDGIFNLSNEEYNALNLSDAEKELVKPFYTSNELTQYYGNSKNSLWVIYTSSKFKNKKEMLPYPKLRAHLDKFAKVITSDNKPYGLHRSRDENFFKGIKIVSLRKTSNPCFTYTDFDCYVSQSYNIIKTERFENKSLVAILNSSVIRFWLLYKGKMQGDNFQVDKEPLLNVPIAKPTADQQQKLSSLATQMLDAHRQLGLAKSEADKAMLAQRIDILDAQINALVYSLYGLTKEEIAVVEGK